MTLYRQLLFYTLVLLLILFTGLWFVKLKTTQTFLINQMHSHAQDTATSLGLSISSSLAEEDEPIMETMVNAIFDRGYYRTIHVKDIEGSIIVNRQVSVKIDQIPSWFIHFVPLTMPSADSKIMKGWQQIGSIHVESHPGYAYSTLWETARTTTYLFAATFLLVALAGGIILQVLLRPLVRIEKQAIALSNREYQLQKRIPYTREFKRVVMAMNKMTQKVRSMFDEQASIANSLRQEAYQDQLTGFGNRRFLEGQLQAQLSDPSSSQNGFFLLFQVHGLQEINIEHGYQAGDALIKEAADIIYKATHTLPTAITARLTGGDFAVVLPDTEHENTLEIAEQIGTEIQRQISSRTKDVKYLYSIGGTAYFKKETLSDLLAKADSALRISQNSGSPAPVILSGDRDHETTLHKSEWKQILQKTLAENTLQLHAQPTVELTDFSKIIQHEIYARIQDNDTEYSAEMFIPAAERADIIAELDKAILTNILSDSRIARLGTRVAVNISPLSLQNEDFTNWLLKELQKYNNNSIQFNFELPEFRISHHLDLATRFRKNITPLGHHLGIDHFGRGLVNFGYLKTLKPRYVKISKALLVDLEGTHSDAYFFITSLCSAAHSLDVKVVAEGVETDEQWKILKQMPLDSVQGYYIQKPKRIDDLIE